jgi:hypothetical protein
MIRITENENKEIRKMYGLISEATEADCKNNTEEFKEFRVWCSMGNKCRSKGYKIIPVEKNKVDNICADTELIRAYSNPEFYKEFQKYMGR